MDALAASMNRLSLRVPATAGSAYEQNEMPTPRVALNWDECVLAQLREEKRTGNYTVDYSYGWTPPEAIMEPLRRMGGLYGRRDYSRRPTYLGVSFRGEKWSMDKGVEIPLLKSERDALYPKLLAEGAVASTADNIESQLRRFQPKRQISWQKDIDIYSYVLNAEHAQRIHIPQIKQIVDACAAEMTEYNKTHKGKRRTLTLWITITPTHLDATASWDRSMRSTTENIHSHNSHSVRIPL